MNLITLQEARSKGTKHYFTGVACRAGHIALRLVSGRSCTECLKVNCKSWSKRNKEHLRRYSKAYISKTHGQNVRKEYAKYYASTPNGKAAHVRGSSKRRALKLNATVQPYSYAERVVRFDLFNNECCYCGYRGKLSEDHFIPLTKGGKHSLTNIVPACKSCNSSKHNSLPQEWYKAQPFYSKIRWINIMERCNGQA